jgi:hypothetical protein
VRYVVRIRVSPAILVSALALVAAATGMAVAEPDATTSALSKKKVKKIAAKQVEKLAPGLSVADSAALGGKPASSYVTTAAQPFRNVGAPGQPPFLNGWQNLPPAGGFYPAGFYKDSQGFVHLRGTIEGNDDDGPAFALPAGFRPSKLTRVSAVCPGGGSIVVETNGEVNLSCPEEIAAGTASIDGIAFRVP